MPNQIREVQRAPTLGRAVELLQHGDRSTAPLGIGPRVPDLPFPEVDTLVDLHGLGLDVIAGDNNAIRIGALTPLQSLVESALLIGAANGILSRAAYLAAHFGLRNLATVGGAVRGALDETGGPPEVALALLALGANLEAQGGATEQMPLAGYRPSSALLTAFQLTCADHPSAALARVARSPLDQAIVAAVAVVTDKVVRVAVAGAAPAPIIAESDRSPASASTITQLVNDLVASAAPIADYRGSAGYRRAMTEVLARRALSEAFADKADS